MQTGGALQGANTLPGRGWLTALLAVLAIAAITVLLVWAGPIGFGGIETQDTVPVGGTVIVHDDAGAVHTGLAPGYVAIHDDAGNLAPVAGTAIVHDDAGNVNR